MDRHGMALTEVTPFLRELTIIPLNPAMAGNDLLVI
jgi:hypothetical protein